MNVLLEPDRRPVIAHRGGSAHGPENTLEAMRLAIADGADGLEFDVRLSADAEVVLIHDPTVDRTTDGTGLVERMTLAELTELDAGFRFRTQAPDSASLTKARIPTLDEVLRSCPGIPLIIEIKDPLAATATRRVIEKHEAQNRCLVESFSSTALSVFRDSRIARGAGRSGVIRLLAKSFTGAPSPVPEEVSALAIPRTYHGLPLPLRHLAATMRSARKPIHVWTVNLPEEARAMWELGASGIITDDVAAILAARSRQP
ncbi:MAG: glycerophosphodiester phosphodiesterase family protein [Gemmatimonadales bacterium]